MKRGLTLIKSISNHICFGAVLVSFLLNCNGVFLLYNVFKFSNVYLSLLPEGHNKLFLPVNVGFVSLKIKPGKKKGRKKEKTVDILIVFKIKEDVLFFFVSLKFRTRRAGSKEIKIFLK